MGPKTLLAVLALLCAALGLLVACGSSGGRSPAAPEDGEVGASAPAPRTQGQEEQPATQEGTREQAREEEPPPEQARSELEELLAEPGSGAGPAYTTVGDGTGALSLEVPAGWGEVIVGEESEAAGSGWSAFEGVGVPSSITAAPFLDAWHNSLGAAGTYAVASRILAQRYTDEELVAMGPNDFSSSCVPGARSGFSRPPYSGVVQAWKGCGGNPAASYVTLSAAPEGRECVVVLQVGIVGEGGVEAGQHILETFESDCGLVPYAAEVPAEQHAYEPTPGPAPYHAYPDTEGRVRSTARTSRIGKRPKPPWRRIRAIPTTSTGTETGWLARLCPGRRRGTTRGRASPRWRWWTASAACASVPPGTTPSPAPAAKTRYTASRATTSSTRATIR